MAGAGSKSAQGVASELAERGLAKALAAALWEGEAATEDASAPVEPLPSEPPGLAPAPGRSTVQLVSQALASDLGPDLGPDVGYDDLGGDAAEEAPAAAPVAPAPAPAVVVEPYDDSHVRESLAILVDRVEELSRLEKKHAEHVDRLVAENRTLRDGEVTSALTPLLLNLARLADRMDAIINADDPGGTAGLLKTQLMQLLEGVGFAPDVPEIGSDFDPSVHRGCGTREVDDPAMVGKVVRTVRPGWRSAAGRTIRVAEVEVGRLRADGQQSPASSARPDGGDPA
ncbi:MAG TPA: nucleotide exchange factor GrpE [Mycobacteriales bacterium]|nr:nucleotide exchange factor GrpE [Mycobacteriales bacterium]